ncbi:MAG: hypothetical protein A2527_05175 [Candidatus Lambdaproteobacteria bacterium RIFOXYD2_FULL_50_16]|uniref:Uncharacterized protein n=1 Tax=Candidatus Lambdaproteobacteria bacterium RIFOXYD2_FULL_50_16 TaxID=1817772 RepID=A0A1F6G9W3_9PROT|nr:MAG: hypothetical protein A2527_05175 [Candidatus Lambdaproteobacteria bacterium RIFOXYD2_FULL_50_16]
MNIEPKSLFEQLQQEFDSIVPPAWLQAIQTDAQALALKELLKKIEKELQKLQVAGKRDFKISFLAGQVCVLLNEKNKAAEYFAEVFSNSESTSDYLSASLINLLKVSLVSESPVAVSSLIDKNRGRFELGLKNLAILSQTISDGLQPEWIVSLFDPAQISSKSVGYLFIQSQKGEIEDLVNFHISKAVRKTANRLLQEAMTLNIAEHDPKMALQFLICMLAYVIVSANNTEEDVIAGLVSVPFRPEFATIFEVETVRASEELVLELGT